MLGLWDGNPIKMDCDDHCITTNVINSLSNKKKKKLHTSFRDKQSYPYSQNKCGGGGRGSILSDFSNYKVNTTYKNPSKTF